MDWTWWPVPRGAPWDWGFAPYPAALAFALLPAAVLAAGRLARIPAGRRFALDRRLTCFAGGSATLLLALAWPLGPLATVSLAARATQYLLITLAAAPLLLLGVPRWSDRGRGRPRRLVERALGSPSLGAPLLAAAVIATHIGPVVEAEAAPTVAAAIRGAWLLAALAFWWPLVGPGPDRERLPYLGALAFLVLPFVVPKLPGAVFVFAERPVYDRFATPGLLGAVTPEVDQGLAGFLLWFPGSVMVVIASWLLFRRWAAEDRGLRANYGAALPADPEVIDRLIANPDAWRALEAVLGALERHPGAAVGVDLAFETAGRSVTVEVRLHASAAQEAAIRARVYEAYASALAVLPPERREAAAQRLRVEVVSFGSRVQ